MRLLFVKAGMPMNMNEISKILKVSQTAVAKAVPFIEKEGLIRIEQNKESKRWSIELNRDNRKVIGLKRADNLKQLYDSNFVKYLYDTFPEATIILFGSYSLGEDTVHSDIDLAVIGSNQRELDEDFDKIFGRKIIVNHYKNFNKIDKPLLSNILNGITLKGAVELK